MLTNTIVYALAMFALGYIVVSAALGFHLDQAGVVLQEVLLALDGMAARAIQLSDPFVEVVMVVVAVVVLTTLAQPLCRRGCFMVVKGLRSMLQGSCGRWYAFDLVVNPKSPFFCTNLVEDGPEGRRSHLALGQSGSRSRLR